MLIKNKLIRLEKIEEKLIHLKICICKEQNILINVVLFTEI